MNDVCGRSPWACLWSARIEQARGLGAPGCSANASRRSCARCPWLRLSAGADSNRSTGTPPWADPTRAHHRRTQQGSGEPGHLRRRSMTVSTRVGRGLAAAAAAALLLTACSSNNDSSSSSSSASSAGGQGIVTAYSSEPQNPLIPQNTNEQGGTKIIQSINSGLVYYDAKGEPQNDLADKIEATDPTTYKIALKDGLKWSDGSPVTAKNFVDAWNWGALSTNAAPLSSFYAPIEGYDAVSADPPTAQTMSGLTVDDDTHFTVKLARPQADFALQLGYIAFYPMPDAAFKDIKAFGEAPLSNGPYMLKSPTAWQHNVKIDLVPNPDYKGPRQPKNGGLTLKFYETSEAAYNDLLAGSLDILEQVPTSALTTYKSDLGDRSFNQPSAVF